METKLQARHALRKGFMAVALAAVLGTTPSQADEVGFATAAQAAEGQEPGVPALQRLAASGDARAQEQLASAYFEGKGVARDYARSLYWLRRAARQGNTSAQSFLGVMYLSRFEEFVQHDEARGLAWLCIAAEGGDAYARQLATLTAMTTDPEVLARARKLIELCRSTHNDGCGEPDELGAPVP